MLINDHYFHLQLNQSDLSIDSGDPLDFVYSYSGTVIASTSSDEEIIAGKFRAYYIDIVSAINDGTVSVFDVFDSRSCTLDYYSVIYENESFDINEKLLKALDCDPFFGNVLIIDRLEILPAFRAHNLGLVTMRRLMQRFGAGASIAAIKPFPLQFEANKDIDDEWSQQLKLPAFDKNNRSATARLKKYYRKLGFVPLPSTPFMFLELERTLVSVNDLLADNDADLVID